MPIVDTDLVLYASANMPDTNSGNAGGAIDLLRFLDFTQIAADDDIEVVSSIGGDVTQNVLVEGRQEDGTIDSESKLLVGTTAQIFATLGVIERIIRIEMDATAGGVVTVRRSVGGTAVRALPIGKRGAVAMHRKTTSNPTGGGEANFYAKGFWRNEHATLSLLSAVVKQNADPESRITHLLATAVGDTAVSTNRITPPAAGDTQDPDTFDDNDKNVPGTDLAALASIGVWFELKLPEADGAHRADYTSELSGETV